MWVKFLCVASLVCVVCCVSVPPGKYRDEEFPSEYYELPCMTYGGLCLPKHECPEGKEAGVSGLCPLREHQGVECCYSVPKSSTTCRLNGGECMPSSTKCPRNLTFSKASDCEGDEKCCILIN